MKQVAEAGPDLERPGDFETLFLEQYQQMVRVAYLMLGSRADAEDAVQDAFARVQLRFDRLDNPGGYLRRCVVNRATDLLRRRRLEGQVRRLRQERSRELAADEMADALAALPPRQRAAVVLRFYADMSERDMAETLGVAAGTVKSLLHRGLATLREAIER